MTEFTDFFATDWQALLESVEVPGLPNASWDRKACYLYLTKEGTAEMAPAKGTGRGRKPAVNDSAKKIIEALAFTKIAVKQTGEGYERMVYLTGGWAMTHDGVIAIGAPIGDNDIVGYVDHALLTAAITNVGKELSISSAEHGIEIASGDYEVLVPSGDPATMRQAPPDGGERYTLGDEFRGALEVASRVVKDSAETVRDASIYCMGKSLLATNGLSVVEAYHGHNVPPGCVFPRAFAVALNKTDKKLTHFSFDVSGYRSFTVWFEDGSFMRTALYPFSDYPQTVVQQYEALFGDLPKVLDTPKGFFEAVKIVTPFAPSGVIAVTGGAVVTDYREGEGFKTGLAVKGLPEGIWISGERIIPFADAAKVYFGDPNTNPPLMLFVGPTWRAMASGVAMAMPVSAPPVIEPPQVAASMPDPASAPAWGAPPAAETPPPAPQAAPAPAFGGPAQYQPQPEAVAPAPQAITLPYTPYERHTSMVGAPGWDRTPYTLQPGEVPTQFTSHHDNEARALYGWPPNPTPAGDAAPATPAFAAPVATPAFSPPTLNNGQTVQIGASPSDTPFAPGGAPSFAAPAQPSPSTETPAPVSGVVQFPMTAAQSPSSEGGFAPFQPPPAGAPTTSPPAPGTAPAATETAPATASPSNTPSWMTNPASPPAEQPAFPFTPFDPNA